MLTPRQIRQIPDPLIPLIAQLEDDIIRDLARRIAKAKYLTPTAEWQMYKASILRLSTAEVQNAVAKYAETSRRAIEKIMTEECEKAIETDAKIYRSAGKNPDTYFRSLAYSDTIMAGIKKTDKLMRNFTATTAVTASHTLIDCLDRAYLQITSGAFSLQQAVTMAVSRLAEDGLKVIKFESGRTDQLDVAVRRAIVTAVGQTTGTLQLDLAAEMDCDLVEVTSHMGARPTHAVWQGGIYSISGRTKGYRKLSEATGYGTGAGLKGWNCRHDFFPFFEGISLPNDIKINAKENAEEYEKDQKQRAYERSIRKTKRKLTALDEAIRNTDDNETKRSLQRKFDLSSARLKDKEQKFRGWLNANGRMADTSRVQTAGYNRSVSGKAVWAAKRVEKTRNGGIIKGGRNAHDILGKNDNGHYYYQTGKIKPSDKTAVKASLKQFYADTLDDDIEKCLVIAKDGNVYIAVGDLDNVDTTLLGDKLSGSINIHNHVKSETEYSFSKTDVQGFFDDESAVMAAYDYKYTYVIRRSKKSDKNKIYDISELYKESYFEALETCQYMNDEDYTLNIQHELIRSLSKKCGLLYRRIENDR